jgi:hypothetical protein
MPVNNYFPISNRIATFLKIVLRVHLLNILSPIRLCITN